MVNVKRLMWSSPAGGTYVQGVDGSILLDVPGHSEKYAQASRTLRGFELIEEIKKELEAKCHATVSCADILTAAARDAVASAAVRGPYWTLNYGRKDRKGYFSANTADRDVPMGGQSVTQLISFFEKNGLNIQDLVALSGELSHLSINLVINWAPPHVRIDRRSTGT